jgi:asparagine synthase (glutamine-hydrolysing)
MCGFTGINTCSLNFIEHANKLMKYRGPDYSGTYVDQNMSIGHVLLSLRGSVSDGMQPVMSETNPWVLVFNGQIYNTKKICSDNGIIEVPSDTLILYQLIVKFGWDFYKYIDGMYAIALYNKNNSQIRLYRDSAGQKPLYYYHKNNIFLFSSELKVILSHPSINKSLDEESTLVSLSLGYIPAPNTLWKFIKKVNISEFIIFDIKNNSLYKESFFKDLPEKNSQTNPKKLIEDTLSEHLQSNTDIKINLSGGLDSSLIYALANRMGYKLESFTTKYETNSSILNEDAFLARKLAKKYGGKHYEININQDAYLNQFIEAYETIEEPCYNQAAPSHFIMAKFQKNNSKSKIVLSGDGGDEVFSGYTIYKKNKIFDQYNLPLVRNFFNLYKNRRAAIKFDYFNSFERWLGFKCFFNGEYIIEEKDIKSYLLKYEAEFNSYCEYHNKKSNSTKNHMLADRFFWLTNENFNRIDKIFMSQSIEVRSPFSYQPLRDYFDLNIQAADIEQSQTSKQYIKKMYKDFLPDYIINHKKSGWASPVSDWYNDKTKNLFLDIISNVEKNDQLINWKKLKQKIIESDRYPGKWLYSYLSLAILSNKFSIGV